MKRICSLIISIVMLFSVASVIPVSAEAVNYEAANYALEVLKALNIADSELDENSFSPEQKVTRAEFAIYLCDFLEMSEEKGSELYYNDVPENHYAYNEITVLTRAGYLRGVSENTFSPDESIQTEHVLRVFLKVLGYGSTIKIDEEDTARLLSQKELTDNLSGSAELLLGDLYIIMFNTLVAGCVDMNGVGSDGVIFDEDTSYLHMSRKMDYVRNARVTAASGASVLGESRNVEDVVIDGEVYRSKAGNLIDYLGYEVDFIYYQPTDGDEKEIIWMKKQADSKVLEIEVDGSGSYDAVTGKYTYYSDDGKPKTVALDANVSVVYNGRFLSTGISEVLNRSKYNVTLLDISQGGGYDTAIVWEYANIFVAGKDEGLMEVSDRIGKRTVSFNTNDYEYIEITDVNGKKLDFSAIAPKTVVSVYLSNDNKYLKAVVCSDVVSGNITGKMSDERIAIDETWYEFYNEADAAGIGSAKSMTAYLDIKGKIAYADKSYVGNNSIIAYAYMANLDDSVFSKKINLKVLCEDGEIKTFETAEKVTLDDENKSVEQIFTDLGRTSEGKFKPQLLCLNLNQDNQINKIYRATDNGGTTNVLIKHQEQPTENKYWANCLRPQDRIGRLMAFDGNTKVFYVPNDVDVENAKDKDFSVGAPVYDQQYPGAISYKTTEENIFFEQYIVTKQQRNVALDNRDTIVLVESIGEGLDQDMITVPMIIGMQAGNDVSFIVDEDYVDIDALGIKSGDIIRVLSNGGTVEKVELLYSYGGDNVMKNAHEVPAEFRYVMGEGHSKEGDMFKLSYHDEYLNNTVVEIINTVNAKSRIMVYDSNARSDKVYKGSVSDINTLAENGKASKVFVQNYIDQILGIVVYK